MSFPSQQPLCLFCDPRKAVSRSPPFLHPSSSTVSKTNNLPGSLGPFYTDHLVVMTRIVPMQLERRKLLLKETRCFPHLESIALRYSDIFPIWGERSECYRKIERYSVDDSSLSKVHQHSFSLCCVNSDCLHRKNGIERTIVYG